MQKVNEEKLLHDHAELIGKRGEHLAEIEADAREYATNHGYDEEKTEKFIAFTKELEGDGLSAEENAKLELLGSYIDEVEDPVEKPETVESTEVEDTEEIGTSAMAFPYGTVTNI